MKLSELKGQGVVDRLTQTYFQDVPHLDKFAGISAHIEAVDAEEARDTVAASYREMWAFSERLAEHVKTLRSLGHKDLREHRVLAILDDAIKALEAEGLGA